MYLQLYVSQAEGMFIRGSYRDLQILGYLLRFTAPTESKIINQKSITLHI